ASASANCLAASAGMSRGADVLASVGRLPPRMCVECWAHRPASAGLLGRDARLRRANRPTARSLPGDPLGRCCLLQKEGVGQIILWSVVEASHVNGAGGSL